MRRCSPTTRPPNHFAVSSHSRRCLMACTDHHGIDRTPTGTSPRPMATCAPQRVDDLKPVGPPSGLHPTRSQDPNNRAGASATSEFESPHGPVSCTGLRVMAMGEPGALPCQRGAVGGGHRRGRKPQIIASCVVERRSEAQEFVAATDVVGTRPCARLRFSGPRPLVVQAERSLDAVSPDSVIAVLTERAAAEALADCGFLLRRGRVHGRRCHRFRRRPSRSGSVAI